MTSVGIDKISFYTANFCLDLKVLANRNNIDPNKYYKGIGQEKMSIPAHDEDIVTMAANAAARIVDDSNRDSITSLLFATETGIDQSKAAGVYVHRLLNINPNCRVVELKQACYSATAAIQMACAMVARQPEQKVLVVASDVARYDLDTPAEATQGCGAIALLISANPRIMEVDPRVGNYTEDVMDFWRPNYRKTALVDGKFSTEMYLKAVEASWNNFCDINPLRFKDFARFCYHLPFSRMGEKAHQHLLHINNQSSELLQPQLEESTRYNRLIGNSYSASLYIGLASLLDHCEDDLSGQHIGLFSYGSGCVAEFFAGKVLPNYREHLLTETHHTMLASRKVVAFEEYIDLLDNPDPQQGEQCVIPESGSTGRYRLSEICNHKRGYAAAR